MKKKLVFSVSVVLLLVMVVLSCVACTPNANITKKKLEKKGFEVEVVNVTDESELGLIKFLQAFKGEDEYVIIYWFSNHNKLNDAYKEAERIFDEWKAQCEEGEVFELELVKKGKSIIQGTKAAVKIVG